MTIERPSVAISFWLEQEVSLAFKNVEAALQKLVEEINAEVVLTEGLEDALATITLAAFAPTTSAELAGIISDETGTGLLVFGTSPTLTTPIITNPAVTTGTFTSPVVVTDITIPNTGLHLLDTNATHDLIIAPGSNLTADRTLTVTTGDANRALSLTGDLTVTAATTLAGAASDTVAGPIRIATDAEVGTGTSMVLAVVPGRQYNHKSAAKFWVKFNSAGTILAQYNVASITDHGTGSWTVNIGTDFSSANWVVMVTGGHVVGTTLIVYNVSAQAAGTVSLVANKNTDVAAVAVDPNTPDAVYVVGFGDQ